MIDLYYKEVTMYPHNTNLNKDIVKREYYQDFIILITVDNQCYKITIYSSTFDKKKLVNTPSHNQSTDTPSSDLNHDVPQSTLSGTAFSTPSTKQAKLPFALQYEYPSAFRPHPILPHNKHLSNEHYDSGSVLQPFLKHVPGGSPRRE